MGKVGGLSGVGRLDLVLLHLAIDFQWKIRYFPPLIEIFKFMVVGRTLFFKNSHFSISKLHFAPVPIILIRNLTLNLVANF